MFLKSLELHGFKSFPNRTVLKFEPGATVIVGPNGSGKSNLSDAMRWVLGELSSRNIRGSKMEDVIFGGTDTRKQMGFAEVSVTFDNTDANNRIEYDYDEITVTRRYYRTGQSDYFINKKPCRLKDIHKLFLNTGVGREGYSIIGQGKIAEILSKKSEDRRTIFEEAAGVSKYRIDKETAERNLANNEINYTRLNDRYIDLDSRIKPLEKEAEKARKGMEIAEKKKILDVALWLYDTKDLREKLEKVQEKFRLSEIELENANESSQSLVKQQNSLREHIQNNTFHAEELYSNITELTDEIHNLEKEYDSYCDSIKHSQYIIDQNDLVLNEILNSEKSILEKIQNLKEVIEKSLTEYNDLVDEKNDLKALLTQLDSDSTSINRFLESSFEEINELERLSIGIDTQVRMHDEGKKDTSKEDELNSEILKINNQIDNLKQDYNRSEEEVNNVKKQLLEIDDSISNTRKQIGSLILEKEDMQKELNSKSVEIQVLREKAKTYQKMEENNEGYSFGVRYVIREAQAGGKLSNCGKVYGSLSKLIHIDDEYVLAIETALGGNMQNIVVDNESTAKNILNHMKMNQVGRVTLYPITSISAHMKTETDRDKDNAQLPGFIDRADRLVKADQDVQVVSDSLLCHTLVFDTLANASNAAKSLNYKVKIVTLDGQVINVGGSYTGGSSKKDGGLISRQNDILRMNEQAEQMENDLNKIISKIKDINNKVQDFNEEIENYEQNKQVLNSILTIKLGEFERVKSQIESNNDLIDRYTEEIASYQSILADGDKKISELKNNLVTYSKKIEELRKERVTKSNLLNEVQTKRDSVSSKLNELEISIKISEKELENKNHDLHVLEGDLEVLRIRKNEKTTIINNEKEVIEQYKAKSDINQKNHDLKKQEVDEKKSLREEVIRENESFTKRQQEVEQELINVNDRVVSCTSTHTQLQNRLENLQMESNRIGSKIYDDYELTIEDALKLDLPEVTKENRGALGQEQTHYKNQLRGYGDFRPAAIDEYAEVKTQYEDLTKQLEDINNSIDDLKQVISKIEEQMKVDFMNAFEKINENFGIVFAELFGGGSAELSLTNPEDVLTSGIEIKAAPPGKIIKSLTLLSGGEQTFVAIALLFAIIKVNPTPFCIFDEIEAALDDVNVFRFADYVRKLSADNQFIIITHRRGTMEVSDRLYGITMIEKGISQAALLDVNQIEKQKKEAELWDSSKH